MNCLIIKIKQYLVKMSDSIKVAVKVRPLIKREKDDNLPIQWTVQGNSIVSTDPEMKKRGDGGFCFGIYQSLMYCLRTITMLVY